VNNCSYLYVPYQRGTNITNKFYLGTEVERKKNKKWQTLHLLQEKQNTHY